MSNELVKHESKEIATSSSFTEEQIATIKSMYCKGATDDEFKVFLYTCQRTGLDPFAKQVYAIKRKENMTIQTSIDGYRLVAERTGRYCPGQKPTFEYDKNGKLLSATAFVKKLTKDGTWHTVEAEAAYQEYVQAFNGKASGLWEKMPRTMLAKCAEALAIRKCFPAELSGVYTKEEMEQAEVEVVSDSRRNIEITAEPVKAVEYISSEQAEELRRIISECDPSKMDVMLEHVRKKCNGGDITQLPAKCFKGMLELFLDRRAQYLAKQIEEKMNGEEVQDE